MGKRKRLWIDYGKKKKMHVYIMGERVVILESSDGRAVISFLRTFFKFGGHLV